ncbi:MAG: AraC family transcriptional regulator [Eubacteriales bacterium]|nr:AraC family transcriptional regulator [Eubacteriales bacterium]
MNIISSDTLYFTFETSSSWNAEFHMHNFCEIYLLLKGEVDFFIDDSRFRISPGTLIPINDYELHKAILVSPGEYQRCYIHIPKRYFQRFSSELTDVSACFYNRRPGRENIFRLTPEQSGFIQRCIRRMMELRDSSPFGCDLLTESCLVQVLVLVNSLFYSGQAANACTGRQYSPAVASAIAFLDAHLLSEISLEQIAKACCLEKHYLCRLFKKETGVTPFRFLLLKRLSLSKQLLSQGYSVTEACFRTGFRNYNNFITTFRNQVGCTPGQYQREL